MSVLDSFNHQILGKSGAPRLVFLHGLMGSGANWRKITSNLSEEFEMLVFDQRGHGRSFQPARGYQPENYAQDLNEILDELGWDKVHLLGHSMGGRNAMVFSSLFPQRINKLVIVDISPEADERAVERIEFLLGVVPVPFENKAAAKTFFADEFAKKLKGIPKAQDLGNYFYTNIEEKPDGSANWRFSLEGILESLYSGRARDYWKEVESIASPTLVIRGGNSNDLTQAVYQKMLNSNPNIQGQVIEGAGHWVHFDKSEEFTRAVKAFLRQT